MSSSQVNGSPKLGVLMVGKLQSYTYCVAQDHVGMYKGLRVTNLCCEVSCEVSPGPQDFQQFDCGIDKEAIHIMVASSMPL
jgi:hypothetical protein